MPKITKEEKVLLDAAKKVCQYYGIYNNDTLITNRAYEKVAETALIDLVKAGTVTVNHNNSTYFVKDI